LGIGVTVTDEYVHKAWLELTAGKITLFVQARLHKLPHKKAWKIRTVAGGGSWHKMHFITRINYADAYGMIA
jgi:hypothetical protein